MNKRIKLDYLLNKFLAGKIRSQDTVRSYIYAVKTFQDRTKVIYIDEINYDILIKWRDDLLETASAITFNSYLRQMRAILNFAQLHQMVAENECKKICFVPQLQTRKKTTSDKAIKNLIESIANSNEFEPAWFVIALLKMLRLTGIRRRQLIGIRWTDICLQESVITLTSEYAKSKKINYIPLEPVVDVILLLRQQANLTVGKSYQGQVFNWALFNKRLKSKEMTVDQVSRIFRKINEKLDIDEVFSAHRMRHSFGTEAAKHGDLVTLKEILGHSDIRVTAQYVHPNLKRMRKMMNKSKLK